MKTKKVPEGFRIMAWDRFEKSFKIVRLYRDQLVSFSRRRNNCLKRNAPQYRISRSNVQRGLRSYKLSQVHFATGEIFSPTYGRWFPIEYTLGPKPLDGTKYAGSFRIGCHAFSRQSVRVLERWANQ